MEFWFTKGGLEDKASDLIFIQVLTESYRDYLFNYRNEKTSYLSIIKKTSVPIIVRKTCILINHTMQYY